MKSITRYTFILLFVPSLFSCEKFLNEELKQDINAEDAITNLSDASVALNGCYNGLQSYQLYARDLYVIADLAADNSKVNPQNSGRFLSIYRWNIFAADEYVTNTWNFSYSNLYLINRLLKDVAALKDNNEEEKNRILGEALVLRALTYHYLANFFGQPYNYTTNAGHLAVPLITVPVGVSEKPGRATVAQVYDQILADLEGNSGTKGAISLLSSGESAFYADVYVAYALLSRVYLYMRNWEKASYYALKVINSGKYSLVLRSDFIKSWKEDVHSEQIFYLKFSALDYHSVDMLGQIYMEKGYGDIFASNDLVSLYTENDRRSGWFRTGIGGIYIEKFPGRTVLGEDNIPIFRLAEMYLNAAEAEAMMGHEENALLYVNAIVARAGAEKIKSTGAALLESIKKERRMELCFEGHRLWDIKRWNDDLNRTDLTNPGIVSSIKYGSNFFAYPIPEREIQSNAVIAKQQNPGY